MRTKRSLTCVVLVIWTFWSAGAAPLLPSTPDLTAEQLSLRGIDALRLEVIPPSKDLRDVGVNTEELVAAFAEEIRASDIQIVLRRDHADDPVPCPEEGRVGGATDGAARAEDHGSGDATDALDADKAVDAHIGCRSEHTGSGMQETHRQADPGMRREGTRDRGRGPGEDKCRCFPDQGENSINNVSRTLQSTI